MRLKPAEINAIKLAATDVYGPTAVVRLFGSRIHDHLKGGDIDLHIEIEDRDWPTNSVDFLRAKLFRSLEERWPDVVITRRGRNYSAIEKIAYREGIVL
jgi:uncharacterized protein